MTHSEKLHSVDECQTSLNLNEYRTLQIEGEALIRIKGMGNYLFVCFLK